MRRLLPSIPLVLLAAILGASTGLAQSSSVGPGVVPSSHAVNQMEEEPSETTLTRQEVEDVMLGREAGLNQDVVSTEVSLRRSGLPPDAPLQQEADNNRRIYYIVGGVLVAGGLVAGILALDGGDDGGAGIPPPPTRPQ